MTISDELHNWEIEMIMVDRAIKKHSYVLSDADNLQCKRELKDMEWERWARRWGLRLIEASVRLNEGIKD